MKINPINGNPSEQMNSLEERYPFSRNDQISSSQEEVDESELFFPRVFSRAINHCLDSVGNFFSILLLPLELKNRVNLLRDKVKDMKEVKEMNLRRNGEKYQQWLEELAEIHEARNQPYLNAVKRYQETKDEKIKIWLNEYHETTRKLEENREAIENAILNEKLILENNALYKKYRYNG